MKRLCPILALALAPPVFADGPAEVHIYERTLVGSVATQLSDTTFDTLSTFTTRTAPAQSGYLFTHWSISTTQAFADRDRLGRAKDAVSSLIFEETTFTANYLPDDQDTDADGVADGWEIYWYGDLSKAAASDTDGDGYTFAQELAAGTNPLLANDSDAGGIVWGDGGKLQYNPDGLAAYIVRSEPEGELMETVVEFVDPGTVVTTPSFDPASSTFAYWTMDGIRVADRLGRARNQVSFAMPNAVVELVAVCESDEATRQALYWYGNATAPDSDTDGDGYTFAQELAAGTNPLLPNESDAGGIVWGDGSLLQYNPDNLWPYVIRSEPEGALFETVSDYVHPGTVLTTPSCDPSSTAFAYWTQDGARVADRLGRARNQVSFAMPDAATELVAVCEDDEADRQALYWYGSSAESVPSDSDGDGYTFAQELAAGTNPLLVNDSDAGGLVWADGEYTETDLQVYEQVTGAVVEDEFRPLFTSPIAGNGAVSETFGEELQPIVWDLDGDGLFDLLLVYKGGYRTLLNVGHKGNPEFEERVDFPTNGVDLAMNDTAKLGVLTLDVPPLDALSATFGDADGDGLDDLLVSDADGRIWYYQGTPRAEGPSAPESLSFVLQHKVWGGSHPGFAEGLRLAAVDWEDDGDLDCLCGTADGKLMLLRDPKVGRPTNLKAEAGIDTVVLTWDPNRQSRVRGYRVYRAEADAEATEARIAEPQLPAYRDAPPEIAGYDYKVSAVSRFYTAGNSTPTETESPKTEAVRATLGAVRFFWNDANAKLGDRVEVVVSIENALRYDVAGRTESVTYDPAFLRPVEARTSGLTDGIVFQESAANGAWTVTMTRGVLPAGSGRFLTFVFDTLQAGTTRVGGESGAAVTIAPAGTARYFLGDVDGDGALTVLDIRLLAKLKNGELGRRASAEQLQAGDFNGNGKLDNADYQALRAKLKELGIL